MLELPPQQIDLWCCRYPQIRDATPLQRYRLLPATEEILRLERFRHAADDWRFWQLQAFDDYLVAICADARSSGVQALLIRQTVLLHAAQSLSCPLLVQT